MLDSAVTAKIYNSIDQVPLEQWDNLAAGASITYSSIYLRVIEQADIGGLKDFHYIIIYKGQIPVGIATCYAFDADLTDYTGSFIKRGVSYIRRFLPNFLFMTILECGSAINVGAFPCVVGPGTRWEVVIPVLKSCLNDIAKKVRATVIGFKDIGDDFIKDEALKQKLEADNFTVIHSISGTYIPLRWGSVDAYVDQMKSYYRSKLNKHLKRNSEAHVYSELVDDFSTLSDILARQWLRVHENTAELKREVLNATFYRDISMSLGSESKALLFYSGEDLIGHALLISDRKTLRWLYIGRDKVAADSLYMFMMYTVIETAILSGYDAIDCGPTNYSIKQDLGAKVEPKYYAMTLNLPFFRRFSAPVFRGLSNQNPPVNKTVFKS